MPRNAENSDFYRFVARNPLLASLFKTKNAKMWSERSRTAGSDHTPSRWRGRWRKSAGGWLCGDIPPASLQPSQRELYATNPRCMASARSSCRFPFSFRVTVPRPATRKLRLSSQDHHGSPEARSAKPPLEVVEDVLDVRADGQADGALVDALILAPPASLGVRGGGRVDDQRLHVGHVSPAERTGAGCR